MTADGSPDSPPSPGPDGSPLPAGCSVLRVGARPPVNHLNDPAHALLRLGKAWPGLFLFSTKEKEAIAKGECVRLSVWAEPLTTVKQAWVLVGGNPNNRIVLTLSVDRINSISAAARPDGTPATSTLSVVWEQAKHTATDGSGVAAPDDRPGSQGHCGIDGLTLGTKAQQGNLRQQLADTVLPTDMTVLSDEQISDFRSHLDPG